MSARAQRPRGRGAVERTSVCGLMRRKASMTTLPLTDWMGSMTTATARELSCSNDCEARVRDERASASTTGADREGRDAPAACCSQRTTASSRTRDGSGTSRRPFPACRTCGGARDGLVSQDLARQTAFQQRRSTHRPVCLSMSSIFVWKTWSTDSTVTDVPDWGIAKTSTTDTWTEGGTGTRQRRNLQQQDEQMATHGVLVDKLADHQAHDLHRNSSSAVLEHLWRAGRGAQTSGQAGRRISPSPQAWQPVGYENERTLSRASDEMWTTSPLRGRQGVQGRKDSQVSAGSCGLELEVALVQPIFPSSAAPSPPAQSSGSPTPLPRSDGKQAATRRRPRTYVSETVVSAGGPPMPPMPPPPCWSSRASPSML